MFPLSSTDPSTTTWGRRARRANLTPHEAKQQAAKMVTDGAISARLSLVLEALAVGGVLTSGQLQRVARVATRSLQRYHQHHLLDRLYLAPEAVEQLQLTPVPADRRLYTLGIVGLELARRAHPRLPTGYTGYGMHRIAHDLLCNEVVIRLALTALARGSNPLWVSKYEATVHDEVGRPLLEPDALLTLKDQETRALYLVEYHHEDHGGRAEEKVRRYETTYRDGHWQRAWATDTMPTVLVVWTHKAVGTGYREAIAAAKGRGLRCTYLGKPWHTILAEEHPLQWFNFNTGQMVELFPSQGA